MQFYLNVNKIIFVALHLMLFVSLFYNLIEILNDGLNESNKTFKKSVIYTRIIKYGDLPLKVLVYTNIL